MRAAEAGVVDQVRLLIQLGADPKLQDEYWNTAFDLALYNNQYGTSDLFLTFGFDVDTPKQPYGDTWLQHACYWKKPALARYLLCRGADPKKRTARTMKTAEELAFVELDDYEQGESYPADCQELRRLFLDA